MIYIGIQYAIQLEIVILVSFQHIIINRKGIKDGST